jgi:WD40 repeat protein
MSAARLWGWTTLLLLTGPLLGWGQEPTKKPPQADVRLDFNGDPLPSGAIARLGTPRFRHPGAVHAVAFSEDGKLLAASSDGRNMVVIWDRAKGRKLLEIPTGGVMPPGLLRFSSDNKRLYGSCWYGKDVRFYAWDATTGAEAKDVPALPARSRAVRYSQGGREAILLYWESEIIRWDLEKGKELARYTMPSGYMSAIALVGERVLVAQFGGESVRMWDTADKKQLWSVKATREKSYPGLPMAFSRDGKLIAIETPPRVISVYESVTGKLVRQLEADVEKIYYSLCISPDGRTVAGSCRDASIRLFDLETGRQRAKIPAIEGWVTNIYFAPDSKVFATGGGNNAHAVLLWDTATGKPIEPAAGHTSPVSSVSFSPDSQTVATGSWIRGDAVIRLWDPTSGKPLRSLTATQPDGVSAVAFSPDGRTLAACHWWQGKKVRIWDVAAGREEHVLAGHEAGVTCVAFSRDGKHLASGDTYYNKMGSYEGRLCLWDPEGGRLVHEIRGTAGAIQRVLFTPDGRHVLAAANGVHIYDVDTARLVVDPLHAKARIWDLSLSGDGRLLATAELNGRPRLWELATRREIPLQLPGAVGNGVALTLDGRTLMMGGAKGLVFFHWPSGEIAGKLASDTDVGSRLFPSPDGRRLATAGNAESSVYIWDVADLAKRPLPMVAEPDKVELRRWWTDLRDDDPTVAYQAVWRFAAVPDKAVAYFAKMMEPIKAPAADQVARLIDDLDSAEFGVRDRGSRELERLGDLVVAALRKAKKGKLSLEQARRIDELLAKLDGPVPGPEQLRAVRAVATLEQIGNPQARTLLAEFATGAEGARLTREARASLERLKKPLGSP